MMYFIELSQFSAEDHVITRPLRAQMGRRERNTTHWLEWRGDQSSESFWPDVTLINAARLDWRKLKSIVDECRADTIVLTGRSDSMLSLPVLPHIASLGDLLPLMSGPGLFPPARPSDNSRGSQSHRPLWVDTTPMPAGALF